MTRIISGSAGGRALRTPPGSSHAPHLDRVREALFSRLEHHGLLAGTRVLDLYAGSGALGLEAATAAPPRVLLVQADKRAAKLAHRGPTSHYRPPRGFAFVTDQVARVLHAGPPSGIRMDLVLLTRPTTWGRRRWPGSSPPSSRGMARARGLRGRRTLDAVTPAHVAARPRAVGREALRETTIWYAGPPDRRRRVGWPRDERTAPLRVPRLLRPCDQRPRRRHRARGRPSSTRSSWRCSTTRPSRAPSRWRSGSTSGPGPGPHRQRPDRRLVGPSCRGRLP